MAKLPEASDLRSVVPRTARGTVVDRSGMIGAQAMGDTAQALASVANIGVQVREKEDRFNYARAKSMLLQADTDLRKSLENDPDFSTYEKRYSEGMNKAKQEAAGLIRGGYDRQLFDLETNQDVLRGTSTVRDFAKKKESDWGRSTVDTDLERIRANAITADEATRSKAIDMAKDLIIGAQQRGYYSQEEATNVFQSWRNSAVEGYIEAQPAEKQIEILTGKGNVSDYLQPDVKAKLLEHAKNVRNDVRVRGESQRQADAIGAKYAGNWKAAIAEARKITDPEVRDATESRIKQDWQISEKMEDDYRESLLEQATAFVTSGGKFADLPLNIKNGLKPSTLNSLRNFAEQGAQVKQTDPALIGEITDKLGEGYQAFGDMDSSTWQYRMTPTDFEQYKLLQAKVKSGNIDGKDTGFLTIAQLRGNKATELFPGTKNQDKKNAFLLDFDNRLKALKEEKGKVTTDDAKKLIDDMTVEVALSGWFGGTKKAYELTDEDIGTSGNARTPAVTVPKADRDQIISTLRARNIEVTEDNILRMYRRAQ